jgi:hypothetical protein
MWSHETFAFTLLGGIGALLVWVVVVGSIATRVNEVWRRHHPNPKH